MKLYLNDASPYAQLVRVMLMETGLDGETKEIIVDPWSPSDELLTANPASKVPALRLEDGTTLIESACISDYLIARSGRTALSPLSHSDGTVRLQRLGLGRAAIDCAFGAVIQRRFAPGSPLTARWLESLPRIARALDLLYADRPESDGCDQADLTVAVAFDYVDFRLPELAWTETAPALTEYLASVAGRRSLQSTRPNR